MADTKISSLTELTTPAAADEMVVVDKSDTAMAVSGTDKRMRWDRLRSGIPVVFNVRDPAYGATGDGTTDDTAALQAAIDAAGAGGQQVAGVCFIPSGTYMFSNLKIPAYTKVLGESMGNTQLKRIAGSTGTAIREKNNSGEGNDQGATDIWLENFMVHGNSTAGHGINIGNQVSLKNMASKASMSRIYVVGFTTGIGIQINANAISFNYLWALDNDIGLKTDGGGACSYHGVWVERNETHDLYASSAWDYYYYLQVEASAKASGDSVVFCDVGPQTFYGVYVALVEAPGVDNIIEIASGLSNVSVYNLSVVTNGRTFTNAIKNSSNGTGSSITAIPGYHYVAGSGSGGGANYFVHSATGNRVQIDAGVVKINGTQVLGVQQAANADTSGATLPNLEIEVNQLKAVLRTHGLIAP